MIGLRAFFATLAFVLAAGDACAHASLVSAAPRDGALLAASPAEIVLRFDEPVSVLVVKLLDDTGAPVALPSAPRAEGGVMRIAVPPAMRDGTYLLSYRVTSADSHPIGGSTAFSIGRVSSRARMDDTVSGMEASRSAVRALRDGALLVAVGCALFLLLVSAFPGERSVLIAAGCGAAVLSLAGVGLQGAVMIGHGEILAPEAWRTALRTTFGASAALAAAASLTIALAAGLARGRLRSALLAAGALAAVASLPLTGHAATATPAALARLALGAHALSAALWTGSLVALHALLEPGNGAAAPALRRFSRMAIVAVAVLIAAGAAFAVVQLGSPADLLHTRYGNLVLAKIGLLALLLAVAARNRFVLLPLLERSGAAVQPLRRAIAVEIALVALVVALTAVLVQTPPRTTSIEKVLTAGSRIATLTVTPGRPGRNEIAVIFRDGRGSPFDPSEATVQISNAGAGVEPIGRPMLRAGAGAYRHHGDEIAFPGSWRVEIRARIGDFEYVDLSTVVEIR